MHDDAHDDTRTTPDLPPDGPVADPAVPAVRPAPAVPDVPDAPDAPDVRPPAGAWSLRAWVLLAVLAVVFGFVFWLADQAYAPLLLALGPFGGLAENVLGGAWIVVAPLAAFVLRRPGAAVVAEVLAAGVELVVFGSPFGPAVLLSGLVQGLGAEAAFALTRYRRWGWGTFVLSGVTAAVVTFAYQTVAYGYLGQDLFWWRLAVMTLSCVLLSGVAAKALGEALVRTGVLDGYPAGHAALLRRAARPGRPTRPGRAG